MTDVLTNYNALDCFLRTNGFSQDRTDRTAYWDDDEGNGPEVSWCKATEVVTVGWPTTSAVLAAFPTTHDRLVADVRAALAAAGRVTVFPTPATSEGI